MEAKKNIETNESQKDLKYYIDKTIEKLNKYKKYIITGVLLKLKNNKNHITFHISYKGQRPNMEDVDQIVKDFLARRGKTIEPVEIHINLMKEVKLKSPTMELLAEKNNPKISVKFKIGLMFITHKVKLSESPVIEKLVGKELFDLTNIEHILHKVSRDSVTKDTGNISKQDHITAILFYNKESNKKNINNFIIVILGDKQQPHYHIFNIIGFIFCIESRLFMMEVDSISHQK